ncbi:hypothetical protein GGS24DRAFT_454664 [Hypoxylon argillaceum]|nr:hypothetical protein GGS24DRAFT_454664 [Hypoxylon argillaceum]
MPYLHWERQDEVFEVKKILNNRVKARSESREKGAKKVTLTDTKLNGTEKFLQIYLDEDHPLHIRRTLGQFYYPNSSNIEKRDKVQTALRYFEKHYPGGQNQGPNGKNQDLDNANKDTKGENQEATMTAYKAKEKELQGRRDGQEEKQDKTAADKEVPADGMLPKPEEEEAADPGSTKPESRGDDFKPVLTMVDQLMWVLPKYGPLPPTIITAFPQRSNRDNSKWLTALVTNILNKCDDLSSWTCYQVADVIVAECSRIYLDSTSNRRPPIQFQDIYRTSIEDIMNEDVARVRTFLGNIERLKQGTEQLPSKKSETMSAEADFQADPEVSGKDLDIKKLKPETKQLPSKRSETKSAEDVFEVKPEVVGKLLDIKDDIKDLREIKDIQDELGIMMYLFRIQEDAIKEMYDVMQGKNHRTQASTMPSYSYAREIVERNLEEVKRLDHSAEKAVNAIERLELKQKQADSLLTGAIYRINDATDKQGKTLLTFTVVTIIFLPLSFMASFLALDVAQFPRVGDKLSLNWVVKITLSVSLPLSAVLLFIAFNLNKSQREEHVKLIIDKTLAVKNTAKKAAGDSIQHVKTRMDSFGLRKRNRDSHSEAEEGANKSPAP